MFGGGTQDNFYGFPVFLHALNDTNVDEGSKLAHDAYRVYVNNDYVGNKVLLAQNERIEDLQKYLKDRGFENFSTTLEGNEFVIRSGENEAGDMKSTLHVYLNTR